MEEQSNEVVTQKIGKPESLVRCMEWLQKQNSDVPKKLALQNKNDIQFIIQTNAERKNFLLKAADDDASVPGGVCELSIEPQAVPLKLLRKRNLSIECEWQGCNKIYSDYELYQKHVHEHVSHLHVMYVGEATTYVCLWDSCGYKSIDFEEMVRHINYHSYHAKLMAVGYNGRATLKLTRCKKDSSKRNQLPIFKEKHLCRWVGCECTFNAIQKLYDHLFLHVKYSEDPFLCSWAGCGAVFPHRAFLNMHCRAHTGERLIACYHCGHHFTCNRKLSDHLRRQNVHPNSEHVCHMCGTVCASAYLLREHKRVHVCVYACSMCDMTAPTASALALHVRYKHVSHRDTRQHACPQCVYRAVTRSDLNKHLKTHERKRRLEEKSDEDNSDLEVKKKPRRKYICHVCPAKEMKIFCRGTKLTSHLVKKHGAQWPCGYSRFRYQLSEDGMYRLTTTRFESLEISKKFFEDGYSGSKGPISNEIDFEVVETAEATRNTPKQFNINFKLEGSRAKSEINSEIDVKTLVENTEENAVEITMCDVDEAGNIISSKIIKSDYYFT